MSTYSTRFDAESPTQVSASRRKSERFSYQAGAHWDFFTDAEGTKPGRIENISERGCLLRTNEPIEVRRWIRLIARDAELCFVAVGRVTRRKDEMEAWDSDQVSLYRYGIEFVSPLNPTVLDLIREAPKKCGSCGSDDASIPDPDQPGVLACVLCHLRKACRELTSLS